jgi:hypothetical protein
MDVVMLQVKLMSASCVNVLYLNCQFGLIKLRLTHLTKRFDKREGEAFIPFYSLHAKEIHCIFLNYKMRKEDTNKLN